MMTRFGQMITRFRIARQSVEPINERKFCSQSQTSFAVGECIWLAKRNAGRMIADPGYSFGFVLGLLGFTVSGANLVWSHVRDPVRF